MAQNISQIAIAFPAGASEFIDSNLIAGSVGPDAVKSAAGTLYLVQLDNTANGVITYVQLFYKTSGSVTLGTTVPDKVLAFPASGKSWAIFGGGWAFGTGLTASATTTATGATGPVSAVTLTIIYT